MFVRRYEFYDQNIGVVLGGDDVAPHRHAVDPRPGDARSWTTCGADRRPGEDRRRHARPLRPRLRQPRLPARDDLGPRRLRAVPRTDRRRAAREGRRGSAGDRRRHRRGRHRPAGPDVRRDRIRRSWRSAVELRHLGRGHTDHDIVISVPGPASCSRATCSRTAPCRGSATATRSTGPRRRFASRSW